MVERLALLIHYLPRSTATSYSFLALTNLDIGGLKKLKVLDRMSLGKKYAAHP